jgi:hypothetical protein
MATGRMRIVLLWAGVTVTAGSHLADRNTVQSVQGTMYCVQFWLFQIALFKYFRKLLQKFSFFLPFSLTLFYFFASLVLGLFPLPDFSVIFQPLFYLSSFFFFTNLSLFPVLSLYSSLSSLGIPTIYLTDVSNIPFLYFKLSYNFLYRRIRKIAKSDY